MNSNEENLLDCHLLFFTDIMGGYFIPSLMCELHERVSAWLNDLEDEEAVRQINIALDIIRECFVRYPLNAVAMAFNGGKDCTVVLHLVRIVVSEIHATKNISLLKFGVFEHADEFPEIHQFVDELKLKHGISIVTYPSSYRKGLEMMYDQGIRAVLMGQRRSDPHGGSLEHFSPCTEGWPDIVRVNPILDWSYSTIWKFLKGLNLDYCILYDQGYSSLGSMKTTKRNPHLGNPDGTFRPACELKDGDSNERAYRGAS